MEGLMWLQIEKKNYNFYNFITKKNGGIINLHVLNN